MTLPYLAGCVSYGIFTYLGLVYRGDIARVLFNATGANENMIYGWLSFVGALFLTAVASVAIASIVGAISMDRIVELSLEECGIKITQPLSMSYALSSIWRGLKDAFFQIVVTSVFTFIFLILLIFPPLAFISSVLWIFSLGYSLYDRVLSVIGVGAQRRFILVKHHYWETIFVGALFGAAMLIPFGGIIFFPFLLRAASINTGNWPEAGEWKNSKPC
jgi:hypothetical protein